MCYKCGFTVFSVTGTQVSGQMQNAIEDMLHNRNISLTELTTSVGFALGDNSMLWIVPVQYMLFLQNYSIHMDIGISKRC